MTQFCVAATIAVAAAAVAAAAAAEGCPCRALLLLCQAAATWDGEGGRGVSCLSSKAFPAVSTGEVSESSNNSSDTSNMSIELLFYTEVVLTVFTSK